MNEIKIKKIRVERDVNLWRDAAVDSFLLELRAVGM